MAVLFNVIGLTIFPLYVFVPGFSVDDWKKKWRGYYSSTIPLLPSPTHLNPLIRTHGYVIFRDESATYFISLCQQILMVDFKNIKIFRNAVGHTVCFLRNKKCRSFIFCISNALGAHVVSRIGCFWEILIAGCCRGLTGFNKLVLSTHNAVTTPYIDLSSIIHTVRFVSYSRFWISLFGVNTEFTIWQVNFVYITHHPVKSKLKIMTLGQLCMFQN